MLDYTKELKEYLEKGYTVKSSINMDAGIAIFILNVPVELQSVTISDNKLPVYIYDIIKTIENEGIFEANKHCVDAFGWDLREAVIFVENIVKAKNPVLQAAQFELKSYIKTGRKLEALKYVKEITNWGLKDSKEYIDNLNY